MIKIKFINQLSSLILVVVFLFSCTKDNDLEKDKFQSSENFVELSVIKDIAGGISYPSEKSGLYNKNATTQTKSIKTINEIKNKSEKTSFYIVNYNEGGFVILSADKRTQPILGYSTYNNFSVADDSYPPGLEFWMDDAKKQIEAIQVSNIEQTDKEIIAWELVKESIVNEVSALKYVPIEDCYDHTEVYTKGPLTSAIWEQKGGYNADLPYHTCDGVSENVSAGCVPLAMAQVMKYYEHPTCYNWTSIPDTFPTSTTASFIRDIHDSIKSIYINEPSYSCTGTGVGTHRDMGYVLRSKFCYSSATKTNYNHSSVRSNLDNNRPVILSGRNNSSGHMWVCDGYRDYNFYYEDCSSYGYLHFHMNWGWGGDSNGWFAYNNFNPLSTYNDDKKMIYNIIP
jgi:hypothetical protein